MSVRNAARSRSSAGLYTVTPIRRCKRRRRARRPPPVSPARHGLRAPAGGDYPLDPLGPRDAMPGLLDRDKIFVREHVGMFKAANAYDLLDPATQQVIGRAQQQVRGFFGKMLRFTSWKKYLGFRIDFLDVSAGDAVVLTVTRPFTWFRSKVSVHDGAGKQVGTFRQKLLAIGPKMFIDGPAGTEIGLLKGS